MVGTRCSNQIPLTNYRTPDNSSLMNERGPQRIDFLSRPLTEKEFLLYVTQAKNLFKLMDARLRRMRVLVLVSLGVAALSWIFDLVRLAIVLFQRSSL